MSAPRSSARIIDRPPGHARILGAPRSGKTTLLVERFHGLARAGHEPLVIAFGRDQHDRLLERLIPSGAARFGAMPVTTHGLLATRIIAAARPRSARTLRDVDERIILDRVLGARHDVLKSDLRSISDSASLRDTLLDALHRLAQNGVTAAEATAAADVARDPRALDVLALFADYRRYLDERALTTFYDAAWVAARLLAEDRSVAAAVGVGDVLLVDDFQDLDAGQFELLRALAPVDGKTSLEVFGDPTGSRFSFRGTSDRFLLDAFPRLFAPVDFKLAPAHCEEAALAAAVTSLLAVTNGAPAETAKPALDSLPLFATASDNGAIDAAAPWRVSARAGRPVDEIAGAQHAAACVGAWLRDGVPGDEIVVIARDAERVASLYYQAFRDRGVPLDAGARADTSAHAFLHALIGALGRDSDGRFTEALASSPELGTFCLHFHLPSREIERLLSRIRSTYSSGDGVDIARLLNETLGDVAGGVDAAAALVDDWHRYLEIVERSGGNPSLDEFRRAYLDAQPRESRPAGIPRLVSARALSGHTVRAAIVASCADGIFPRHTIDNGYISTAALAAALERVHEGAARDFAARGDRDVLARGENALLLSVLCAASDDLVLSCPLRSANEHLDPPSVLAPLFAAADEPVRTHSAASRAALAVGMLPAGDALFASAHEIDALAHAWLREAPTGKLPALTGCKLSPSGIDNFMRCARQYFYTKVLYVEEPGSIYLDIGKIFHGVMKRALTEDLRGDEVRARLETGDFGAAIDDAIAEAMNDESDWLKDLTRVHMRNMVRRAARLEAQRTVPYTIRMLEKMLELKVGDEVVLRGQVDRIDDVDGVGPVVVDYKTGEIKKTAATVIKELEVDNEHWQVPVYSELAATVGPKPVAFLFYAMKGDGHVIGLQTVDGQVTPPIPDKGKSRSPYGRVAAATIESKMTDALALRNALVAGEQAFNRTDRTESCRRCHFVHVCRRSNA
jgi:hypothetical protein